jgi:hypothetical protein
MLNDSETKKGNNYSTNANLDGESAYIEILTKQAPDSPTGF